MYRHQTAHIFLRCKLIDNMNKKPLPGLSNFSLFQEVSWYDTTHSKMELLYPSVYNLLNKLRLLIFSYGCSIVWLISSKHCKRKTNASLCRHSQLEKLRQIACYNIAPTVLFCYIVAYNYTHAFLSLAHSFAHHLYGHRIENGICII